MSNPRLEWGFDSGVTPVRLEIRTNGLLGTNAGVGLGTGTGDRLGTRTSVLLGTDTSGRLKTGTSVRLGTGDSKCETGM